MRFTIRDVLWLMVVVGLACGWWIERRQALTQAAHLKDIAERHRKEHEHWRNLAELQLKAFQIVQGNMLELYPKVVDELS